MNTKEKTIRVFAKEIKLTDGRNFLTFLKYPLLEDENIKATHVVKFTRACNATITERGWYRVKLNSDDVNIQRGKTLENGKVTLPTIWIKQAISINKDVDFETKLKTLREQEKIDALDEIPF